MAATRSKITIATCKSALIKANGNITRAAELIGCDRSTLSNRIKRNPKLQIAREQAENTLIDFAESQLWKKVKDGHFPSIKLVLTTKGKVRGWVDRTEITGIDGKDLSTVVVLPPKDGT